MIGETAYPHPPPSWLVRLMARFRDRRKQRIADRERRSHIGYRNIAMQIDNLNRGDKLKGAR